MRSLFMCVVLACCFTAPAFAQEWSDSDSAPGATFTIPEAERGGLVGVQIGAHLVATLDDKLRVATIKYGPPPEEADFDSSALSRTKETLVPVGTVGMWAPEGALGFTLLPMGDQTNLKVSNNTDKAIAYIAAFYRDKPDLDKLELTSTCTVPSGKVVVESWPMKMNGLFIVQVLTPPEPDAKWCVDPTKDYENPVWYSLDQQ